MKFILKNESFVTLPRNMKPQYLVLKYNIIKFFRFSFNFLQKELSLY